MGDTFQLCFAVHLRSCRGKLFRFFGHANNWSNSCWRADKRFKRSAIVSVSAAKPLTNGSRVFAKAACLACMTVRAVRKVRHNDWPLIGSKPFSIGTIAVRIGVPEKSTSVSGRLSHAEECRVPARFIVVCNDGAKCLSTLDVPARGRCCPRLD